VIETALSRDSANILISDTGIGIDQETLDHLFEPMWTTKTSGSGFGLAIAQQTMIEHGGEIEVVDGTHQGTTFRLSLPLRSPHTRKVNHEEAMTNVA